MSGSRGLLFHQRWPSLWLSITRCVVFDSAGALYSFDVEEVGINSSAQGSRPYSIDSCTCQIKVVLEHYAVHIKMHIVWSR